MYQKGNEEYKWQQDSQCLSAPNHSCEIRRDVVSRRGNSAGSCPCHRLTKNIYTSASLDEIIYTSASLDEIIYTSASLDEIIYTSASLDEIIYTLLY
jgi:hypothetical protein